MHTIAMPDHNYSELALANKPCQQYHGKDKVSSIEDNAQHKGYTPEIKYPLERIGTLKIKYPQESAIYVEDQISL